MSFADPDLVVAAARGWLGTPYHDQASLRGVRCDCLGLARGVWREVVGAEPSEVPAYTRHWREGGGPDVLALSARSWMVEIDPAVASRGSMVVFRMRDGWIAKHCGILTDEGMFVHAYERLGVVEQELTEPWRRRIAYAFNYPGGE